MKRFYALALAGGVLLQTPDFHFEYAQSAGGAQVDNRLEIDGAQATWFHEPAVAIVENGVIGVFREEVTRADQQRLEAAMPAHSTVGLRPGMPAVSVRLRANGREAVLALAPADASAVPLIAEAQKIVERARTHPYRALRIDLAGVEPPRVRIENAGTQPLVLDLDDQTLFIESSVETPIAWERVKVAPWQRALTIAPGRHEELDVPAALPSGRPRLVRAIFRRPAADSPDEIGGTASSNHILLPTSRKSR